MVISQDLFRYTDYRTFLKDYYTAKKEERGNWSYNVWARQLGLRSSSMLVMILNGQRNPGRNLITKIVRDLKLDKKQTEYFRDLVRLQKAKGDIGLSLLLMDRLRAHQTQPEPQKMSYETFSAISNWHYFAIREMVHLDDFQENVEWIQNRLNYKVSSDEVKAALQTLENLGLLVRDGDGRLRVKDQQVDISGDVANEALKRFHEGSLQIAKESIRSVPVDRREFYGNTFCLKVENLPKAKSLIRKFQAEFCSLLEEEPGDSVYQLEVGFFPVTKRGKA